MARPLRADEYIQQLQSKEAGTRRLPIDPKLQEILDNVARRTGVVMQVYSGGQDETTGYKGSVRHDHGKAADIRLYARQPDGSLRQLDASNPADVPLLQNVAATSFAYGANGIGMGPDYMGNGSMHIGYGTNPAAHGRVATPNKDSIWGGAPFLAAARTEGLKMRGKVPPAGIPQQTAVASHVDIPRMGGSRELGKIDRNTQDILRYNGFNPGKSDGVFGPKTEAAVKAFQSTHGLKVDGIVGPKTLAALQSATTSRIPPGPVAGAGQPGVVAPPSTGQIGSAFQPERGGWGSNGFTYSWQNAGLRPQIIPTQGGGYPPSTNGFRDPLTAAPPGSATGGGVWPPRMVEGPGFDLGPTIATVNKLAPKRTAVATSTDVPKVIKKQKLNPGSSGRNGTAPQRTQASQGETFDSVWAEAKGY